MSIMGAGIEGLQTYKMPVMPDKLIKPTPGSTAHF